MGSRSPLSRIENGASQKKKTVWPRVVVACRDFVPDPVQPVVAWNYLFCGFCRFDGLVQARFKLGTPPTDARVLHDGGTCASTEEKPE